MESLIKISVLRYTKKEKNAGQFPNRARILLQ